MSTNGRMERAGSGRSVVAATIAFLLLILAVAAPSLRAETPAPTALTTMDGAPAKIADYSGDGKWLVVMIWAVSCHICKHEMPHYGELHAEQRGNLEVLGIALDGRGQLPEIASFLNQRKGVFPNLVADLGPFAQEYGDTVGEGLMGTPTFLVYDPDGELVGSQPGPMKVAALEGFIARKDAEAGR